MMRLCKIMMIEVIFSALIASQSGVSSAARKKWTKISGGFCSLTSRGAVLLLHLLLLLLLLHLLLLLMLTFTSPELLSQGCFFFPLEFFLLLGSFDKLGVKISQKEHASKCQEARGQQPFHVSWRWSILPDRRWQQHGNRSIAHKNAEQLYDADWFRGQGSVDRVSVH